MSATTDRRGNLANQQGNQTRYDEADLSAIGRWVHQRRDQSDATPAGDESESWQNHKDSGISYEPIAERGTAAWGHDRAEDTLQSRQITEDTPPPWRQHGADVRDDHVVAKRASDRERWFRVANICPVVTALGIGSARVSSTISTWAKMATSFMRPKPTTPQPTISDLVQRIDALNGQFDALKQQLNQINTAQTKLNTAQTKLNTAQTKLDAAQGQSTKSAKQLKIAALQQLMVQKHNLPPESLLSTRPPSKRKRLLQLQSRILEPNPSPEQQCL